MAGSRKQWIPCVSMFPLSCFLVAQYFAVPEDERGKHTIFTDTGKTAGVLDVLGA